MKGTKYVLNLKRNAEIELRGDSNEGRYGKDRFKIIIKNIYVYFFFT